MKVNVKPLTVNQAYIGKRYKSKLYKAYITAVMIRLRPMEIPEGELELHIQVGVSSRGFDIDNCAKVFIDILQKKYGFNDNRIYVLNIMKRIVPKKEEYISFEIFECLKENELTEGIKK
jgi:Holliday junction resolvase RusA-like endonuclease